MTDTLTPVRITGEDTAPAPFRREWLPNEGPFPELNELRSEHLRLLDAKAAEAANVWAITNKIEQAQKDRKAALRDAYLGGSDPDEVANSSEELKAELDAAKERSAAASQAVVEHINRAIALVLEKAPEWMAQIEQHEAGVDAEIAELQNQLRAAQGRRGTHFRLTHWIERTQAGAEFPASHFPFGEIAAPPADAQERSDSQARAMEASYAGGLPGMTKISDEEASRRDAEAESSPGISEAERARVEASLAPVNGGRS